MTAEDLLDGILDSSIDCIELLDRDARLILMNRGGLRVMGMGDPHSLVGGSWVQCWADQDAARAAVRTARAGQIGRFQGERPAARGVRKRWDVIVTPVRTRAGPTTCLLSVSRDVTAQSEPKREGDRTRLRHRAIAEANAAIIWRVTPDGSSLEGEGWDAFCGVTVEKEQPDWWFRTVHPDDRETVSTAWHKALRSGEPYSCEFRIRHVSGAYRWVADRGVPLKNEEGSIEEWVGAISDIHERKQAEETLRTSEERLRLALETTSTGIWDADLVTGRRQWTAEARCILGIGANAPVTRESFLNCVHPDDRDEVEGKFFAEWPASGPSYGGTYRIIRADNGQERWVATSGRTLLDKAGRPVRKIGTIQDVTDHKRMENALRAGEERLKLALQAGRMVAWERDLTTEHVARSANARELLGVGSGPLSDFLQRVHPEDRHRAESFIRRPDHRTPETVEFRYVPPSGRMMWLAVRAERAGPDRLIGITFDITDRKMAEEEAWRSSNHDPLTGLPNRALFQHRLKQALEEAEQSGTSVSLLLIDLDDFQEVNDALGHEAGDALLKETAVRLSGMIRDCDTVARFGGDQFMVMIVEPLTLEHATRFADHVIATLRMPFTHAGRRLTGRANIGVAAFPDHASTPTELMTNTDFALRHAKAQGRESIVTYSSKLRLASAQRVALGRAVHEAVSNNQFDPYYQPKVCLATGRIVGFEALARWRHPSKGLVSPDVFGAAFHDPELAQAIGRQIGTKAASDMRDWLDSGLNFGRVAVNLSSSAFDEPELADELLGRLERTSIPFEHFEVEVTETVFLGKGSEHASVILTQLHRQGVRIALDDFGTGYASLTHLKQFPVDHIKIDRSFIAGVEHDVGDEAIIEAVIGLCRKLNIQVTAEGVETRGQARRLRELGCDYAQGYLYSRPLSASQVPRLLSAWDAQRVGQPRTD
ncbi:EAL domain-containing protein [Microvirga sp. TS319]|uniref:EAL domain-containing protein n=1 Tax=Microvirga sp. TS319 TaxID=3241165 RepID=UPI00351A0913